MNTNDHLINDYSAVLDAKYGKEGTPERDKFNEEAYTFYTSQILTDARKEAKVSQTELAKRINTTRAYISKIENGTIDVSAGMFYRIMSALGLRIEIVRPLV